MMRFLPAHVSSTLHYSHPPSSAPQVIRLRDGAIGIRVERIEGDAVICVVLNDGIMGERKVVHFPDVTLHASPTSTYQDMQIIQDFAAANEVNFVAASQVRKLQGS